MRTNEVYTAGGYVNARATAQIDVLHWLLRKFTREKCGKLELIDDEVLVEGGDSEL
jgi:hypothetical protein